jgi:hypothetical protein
MLRMEPMRPLPASGHQSVGLGSVALGPSAPIRGGEQLVAVRNVGEPFNWDEQALSGSAWPMRKGYLTCVLFTKAP